MRDFFGMEGPFNKWGGMLADMAMVSLMWLLFSLPVITAGASTAAMFYVTTRRVSDREGYITSDFWTAFKANFKRATILWLLLLLLILLPLTSIFIITNPYNEAIQELGVLHRNVLFAGQLVILFLAGLMQVFIFPLTARFDMKVIEIIKSAFFMAVRHLPTSLGCVILLVIAVMGFFRLPPLIVVIPGIYAWLASLLIMKVFRKYRPEIDKNPMQEIAEIEAKKAEERWKRDPNEE